MTQMLAILSREDWKRSSKSLIILGNPRQFSSLSGRPYKAKAIDQQDRLAVVKIEKSFQENAM